MKEVDLDSHPEAEEVTEKVQIGFRFFYTNLVVQKYAYLLFSGSQEGNLRSQASEAQKCYSVLWKQVDMKPVTSTIISAMLPTFSRLAVLNTLFSFLFDSFGVSFTFIFLLPFLSHFSS